MRGDEQELDRRCDVGGASGHVTIKPSICNWPAFYKSSIYAMKVWCLTLGGLLSLRWDAACSRKPLGVERSTPTAPEKQQTLSLETGGEVVAGSGREDTPVVHDQLMERVLERDNLRREVPPIPIKCR